MSSQPKLPALLSSAKTELQSRAADDLIADYKEYRTAVLTDGSVEDKRKLVELQMRITGAEADKKGDGFGNLPVFNFIINRGEQGETKRPVGRPRREETIDVSAITEVQALEVSAEKPSPQVPEVNVDELMANLDTIFTDQQTGLR